MAVARTESCNIFTNINLGEISDFDGCRDVQDFIDEFEFIADMANWTEKQKNIMARSKLTGEAKLFLKSEPKLNKVTATWEFIKKELIKRFADQEDNEGENMEIFHSTYQKEGETVVEFKTRLRLAGLKTFKKGSNEDANKVLINNLRDHLRVRFVTGLLPNLKAKVLFANPQTFDEAVELALRAEMVENKINKSKNIRCNSIKNNQYRNFNKHKQNLFRNSSNRNRPPYRQQKFSRSRFFLNNSFNRSKINSRDSNSNRPHLYNSQNKLNSRQRYYYNKNFKYFKYGELEHPDMQHFQIKCFRCNKRGHIANNCSLNAKRLFAIRSMRSASLN